MQVNVAGLRRNIKNLAHNYSDAQVKVREATSNDPWGPSATIMAEIADLTYNVVAFSEIMQMIWKRLNDHGKNWRHVYKALILLEYLIKTGTEKVAQQCKENIFAIQTLREFVYFEEGKDQGTHVREKAKQLANLLKDDERLKNERIKALKAKERFALHPSGFGSDGYIDGPTHRDMPPGWQEEPKPVSELEMVRPQTAGEEELQLQLAMAMSREEAEQEEAKRRSDDVRLQLALSQSEQDFKEQTIRPPAHAAKTQEQPQQQQSHLLDLLDISLGAASISSPPLGAAGGINSDPWGTPARAASQLSDPWSGTSSPPIDPWQPNAAMRTNVSSVPLGAMGGAPHHNDAWALRTHSPSVASGSSTEGWLQTNGGAGNALINGNGIAGAGMDMGMGAGAAGGAGPWLNKNNAAGAGAMSAAAATNSSNADPWINERAAAAAAAAGGGGAVGGLAAGGAAKEDPWAPKAGEAALSDDPWKTLENAGTKKPSPDLDDFDIITNRKKTADTNNSNSIMNNNNSASLLDEMDPLSSVNTNLTMNTNAAAKKPLKTPQAFLGENSALVNLDNLIKPIAPQVQPGAGSAAYNPFSDTTVIPPKTNLFQQQQPAVPSINQLKQQQPFAMSLSQDPWAPVNQANMSAQQTAQQQQQQQQQQEQQKQRPSTLNLNFNCNSNNNYAAEIHSSYAKPYSNNGNATPTYYADHSVQQQARQLHSAPTSTRTPNYDVFDVIRQYEYDSVFDTNPTYNAASSCYGYDGSINNNNNTNNNDYYNLSNYATNNRGSMSNRSSSSSSSINNNNNNSINFHSQYDNGGAAGNRSQPAQPGNYYTPAPLQKYASNYSNELSASLASTPGIKVAPVVQHTTVATVHRAHGYDDYATNSVNSMTHEFYNASNSLSMQQNSSHANATSAFGRQEQCKVENNNNNSLWLKPDAGAAASNPFLS